MTEPLRPRDVWSLSVTDLTRRLGDGVTPDPRLLRRLSRDDRAGVRALAARLQGRAVRAAREAARLDGLRTLEMDQRALGFTVIAGVDEAGVAPLAGPVVAAAVVLPDDLRLPHLNDSKQLTAEMRDTLYEGVMHAAVTWAVGMATVEEIDRLNVLQATRLAHRRAILALRPRPDLVCIDGQYPADVPLFQLVIVDGDATCAPIAAASILAKVTRDRLMVEMAARFPEFGFDRHKGYGTSAHIAAIRRHGITPIHRRSFLSPRIRQEALPLG